MNSKNFYGSFKKLLLGSITFFTRYFHASKVTGFCCTCTTASRDWGSSHRPRLSSLFFILPLPYTYRSIVLRFCIYKVLKKMVNARLLW